MPATYSSAKNVINLCRRVCGTRDEKILSAVFAVAIRPVKDLVPHFVWNYHLNSDLAVMTRKS